MKTRAVSILLASALLSAPVDVLARALLLREKRAEGQALAPYPRPDWLADGNQASGEFGLSVSAAGDVNGDGYDDLIVGAAYYDNGQTDEGRVSVYYGSAFGLSATPDWTAESDQSTAYFGSSVSAAGDVNGDGFDDVIIGAPYYENGQPDEGRAYVYHGSASGLSATPNWTAVSDLAFALFGWSVSGAGDANGDGYGDVIVGAVAYDFTTTREGAAFVVFGSATGLSRGPDINLAGNQRWASFGQAVGPAGEVNGDGLADFVVGAPFYDYGQSNEGAAFVWYGRAP